MQKTFRFNMKSVFVIITILFLLLSIVPFNSYSGDSHKVALILTGGAARGLCHIGVISVLEEYKVPIDIIIGISMGSIVGGYYAYGYSVEDMLKIAGDFRLSSLIEIEKPFTGFLSGEKLEKIFIRDVDFAKIENLKKKLLIIATDINSGKMVIFDRGPLYIAMRASSAIPGVFDPVLYKGKVLVDGGVLTNYPVNLAKRLGADTVIVSNVTVSQTMPRSRLVNRLLEIGREYVNSHKDKFMINKYNSELNLKYILFRTLLLIETNQRLSNNFSRNNVDFIIEPVSDEIKPFDFYKVEEGFMLGRKATLKIIDKIVEKVR